jgi:hypothetical protein
MKKAKVILSAFVVLSAIGGALAFKARTFDQPVYCSTANAGTCISFPASTYHENSTGSSFCTTSSLPNKCTVQSDAPVSE